MSLANLSLNLMSSNSSHLERIRELTERLEPPGGIIRAPGLKQYETVHGKMLSWTIHWQEEFAICHAFLSEGSRMRRHAHDQKEWLIVIDGQLMVTTDDGEEHCLMPRDEIVLEPTKPHEVSCFKDTYVLAITMPAAPDWPRR